MILAPIVLFTYKRLDKLKQTVEALKRNNLADESQLYIYSDGARNASEEKIVQQVRDYINTISGFNKISIVASQSNRGLANSIISGVSEVLALHKKVIVLEDDLITTPNFLQFMNGALERYQHEAKVFSVSGYSFNLKQDVANDSDAYFFTRGWSWGWATWEDRWVGVDWSVKSYEQFRKDAKAKKKFANGGSDLNSMLEKQMIGDLDSWAIRWFYHQFTIGGYTLYPVLSKICNEGWDKDATHTTGSSKRYMPRLDTGDSKIFRFPESVSLSRHYGRLFKNKMGLKSRLRSRLESFVVRLIR